MCDISELSGDKYSIASFPECFDTFISVFRVYFDPFSFVLLTAHLSHITRGAELDKEFWNMND